MATDTLIASIPQLALDAGMSIVFEAIDPTTGAAVAGVVVSGVAIYADDLSNIGGANVKPPTLALGFLPG